MCNHKIELVIQEVISFQQRWSKSLGIRPEGLALLSLGRGWDFFFNGPPGPLGQCLYGTGIVPDWQHWDSVYSNALRQCWKSAVAGRLGTCSILPALI